MESLLARIHTEPLRRAGVPTVALVVFNTSDADVPPCRVRFSAAFPVREPMPVTVRGGNGDIIPSRIVSQTVTPDKPGYVWWSLTLEFAVIPGTPARSAQTFAAGYEAAESLPFPDALPFRADLTVYETGIHEGDLPL
ncbi:MAG: hypothetical protein H7Y38_03115, partial [Armatimonadetes bacterium]|nr:hypothetical protein [Armatimonadota bacterium]